MIFDYYNNYYGHKVDDVSQLVDFFRGRVKKIVFLAGDSSLDNKFWFKKYAQAVNGYEEVLIPPQSQCDVAYHMNKVIASSPSIGALNDYVCINAAVEETSIGTKACGKMLEHDLLIRDSITTDDILIVSIGGNDIALKPNLCTVLNTLILLHCTPKCCLQNACGCSIAIDDCCCGSSTSCLSNLFACPFGFGYFIHLFKDRVAAYLHRLVAKTKPKKILICMIYYADEKTTGSWADQVLGLVGYNKFPSILQLLTRKVYTYATSMISIRGVEVIPVPLFVALDGKVTSDYKERVEPSCSGGAKMAQLLYDAIVGGRECMEQRYRQHIATVASNQM